MCVGVPASLALLPLASAPLAGPSAPHCALGRWLAGTPLTSLFRAPAPGLRCTRLAHFPFSGLSIVALPRLSPSSRPNGCVGHQGHIAPRLGPPTQEDLIGCTRSVPNEPMITPLLSFSSLSLRFIAAPSHLSLLSSSSLLHAPRFIIPGRLFSRSRLLISPLHPSLGILRLKRRRHTRL